MNPPLKIQLKGLPERGRDFEFTHQSGELNQTLKKLIGENEYDVKLQIKPLGGFFEIKGHIKTKMNLLCSRCADPFKYEIDKSFCERIVVQSPMERTDKESRSQDYNPDPNEEYCTVLTESQISLADFIHELIAIEEPIRPLGKKTCDEGNDCENLKNFQSQVDIPDTNKPFAQLKKSLGKKPN